MKNKYAGRVGDRFTHQVVGLLTRIGKLVQPDKVVRKIVVNGFVNLSDDEPDLGGLIVAGAGRC